MSECLWYQASGVLSISTPVVSARTLAGGPAAPGKLGSWSDYTTAQHPNTGKVIEGFHWDERAWYQENTENIAHTVPVNWDPTISGITTEYFQSGIGDNRDLEFDHVEILPSSGLFSSSVLRPWAPVVRHGHYYDYDEEGYLFSDDSEVVYTSVSGVVTGVPGGPNKVQLLSIPKVGVPIRADRYRWDRNAGKYYIDLSVRKVAEFTGVRDADLVRQSTWDDKKQTILWSNVDDTDPEFVVVNSGTTATLPYAIFNGQYSDIYPSESTYEILGYGDGDDLQSFNTTYAPIDSTFPPQVLTYLSISAPSTWREWTPIPTSGEFTVHSGTYQVRVDYDLGTLTFGDNSGDLNVPAAGHTVNIRYPRALRLEYEPELLSDIVTGSEANLNPIYRTSGRGFVYLATRANDAVSITLTASAPVISTNLFGPVNIGNVYVPVIATMTDSKGLPVEAATADIFIVSDPAAGRFGSYGDSASAISNHIGEARAYYNPPINVAEIGETITANNFSIDNVAQTTTLKIENLLLEGTLQDIYLYQIWTNDPLQGWYSPGAGTSEIAQLNEYYRQYFLEEEIYGPTGLTGTALTTTGDQTSAGWEEGHRDAWNLVQASVFNSSNTGKKVLCATYRDDVYNPHTFEFGAVAPFQPTTIQSAASGTYNVVFDTSSYSLPVPSGSLTTAPSGILYGYFMVAPTTVTLQASTYNSRLDTTFYSNQIQIKLQVPSYMNGMWYIDAINSTHINEISSILTAGMITGSGVPLGWRLRSTNITLASALDGVTFLDINPPYNAPIWEATGQPEIVGSGVVASGIPYVQHRLTVSGVSS